MKYYIIEVKYQLNEVFTKLSESSDSVFRSLKSNGFFIVDEFLSPEKCARLRQEIDVHGDKDYAWKDATDSDQRIYGIESVSQEFNSLFNHPLLNDVYKKYIDKTSRNEFIMGNRVEFKKDNAGSGGGWHRDSINRRQLKFIVYLSDVTTSSGCFQYIKQTHIPFQKLKINRILNKTIGAYRYSDENIDILLSKGYKIKDFVGKAGTLLIVETSGIHRGKPIEKGGVRYAATNYLSENPFAPQINRLVLKKER